MSVGSQRHAQTHTHARACTHVRAHAQTRAHIGADIYDQKPWLKPVRRFGALRRRRRRPRSRRRAPPVRARQKPRAPAVPAEVATRCGQSRGVRRRVQSAERRVRAYVLRVRVRTHSATKPLTAMKFQHNRQTLPQPICLHHLCFGATLFCLHCMRFG
eukprot:1957960-Pleurochrysis_carterae.AAC.5